MKRIFSCTLLGCLLWTGCVNNYHTKLSGGYILRHEGSTINDILGPNEIPTNVISCFYNYNFIIAKQKPDKYNHAIYDTNHEYKEGRDKIYYWLIVHKSNIFLGPMNETEFLAAKAKYNVPNESSLKSIIIDTTLSH